MASLKDTFAALKQQNRAAFIPFLSAGDPDAASTLAFMHALVAGGADILELGVPFSDPSADGPVIEASGLRALAAGMNLRGVLRLVADFRQQNQTTPIVLMGYLNPIEQMGLTNFAREAKAAGVDGVLVVDCPPEEAADYHAALQAVDLSAIFLVAPTTSAERLHKIAAMASGFIYYVSLNGVTGAATLDVAAVAQKLDSLRHNLGLPIAVGFGVNSPEAAQALAPHADGVIVGSHLVKIIAKQGQTAAPALEQATRAFVAAMSV